MPAVSTLEMIEPDIMPSRPLAKMQTLRHRRERPAHGEREIDEELAAPVIISAVPNTRKPITVSANA